MPADDAKATLPLHQIAPAADPAERAREGAPDDSDTLERLATARELLEDREYESAVVELQGAFLPAQGDMHDVLYLLAQAYQGLGRWADARIAAELATAYRPDSADAHYLLGELYRARMKLAEAAAHFRRASLANEHGPYSPRALLACYALGQTLEAQGHLLAAAEAYALFDVRWWPTKAAAGPLEPELAEIAAQHPYGLIQRRLELLGVLQQPEARVAVARWAVEMQPEEPFVQRLFVRTLLEAGEAQEAFEYCRARLDAAAPATQPAAIRPAAGGAALLDLAIESGRAAGQLGPWLEDMRAQVATGERHAFAQQLAERLDDVGLPRESVKLWRALVAAHAESGDMTWALAGALRASGELAAALESLAAYLRANSRAAEIPPERLESWVRSFADTEAFLKLVPAWTARPDLDFAGYTVLAITAGAAGQTELAERLFRGALDERPDFALAHVAWGRLRVREYDWPAARTHAEAALAIDAELPGAHRLLADAQDGWDENEAAEAAYRAALELKADAGYALALARHQRRLGNTLAAQRYFHQAWTLDPTRGDAIEELVDSYLEGGKVDLARAAVREAEAAALPEAALRRMRTVLRFSEEPLTPAHLAELREQFETDPNDVRTGLKLAAGLYLTGKMEEAASVVGRLNAHGPEGDQLLNLRARLHTRLLEYARASADFEELVRRYPRRKAYLTSLAEVYLIDFRLEEGRDVLRRILALELPAAEHEAARTQLLATHIDFQDYDAALELLDGWSAEDPNSDAWPRARLRVLTYADRSAEAFELAAERLTTWSAECDALTEKLKAAVTSGEPNANVQAEAASLQRGLQECRPRLMERRADYVEIALETERLAEAEEAVRAWVAAEPGEPQLQEWLIEVLLAARKPTDVLELLRSYKAQTPGDLLKMLLWQAQAHADLKQVDAAVRNLNSVLDEPVLQAVPAATLQLRHGMLTLLIGNKDYSRAVNLTDKWVEEAKRGTPADQYTALTLKRIALQAAEREDELLAVSEQLLVLRPQEPGINNDLGYALAERNEQLERALAMCRLAVAHEPLNAAYLDSLGWVHYKRGEFDAARRFLARAVQLRGGQDATLYDHLGDTEHRLGDVAAARARWEEAVRRIEEQPTEERQPGDTERLAAIRAKLSALEAKEPPKVTPSAAEAGRASGADEGEEAP